MAETKYNITLKAKDKTAREFRQLNKNINSTQQAMKKVASAFAGAFAVRQLVQFGEEALNVADKIGKASVAVGVSAEFLQRYQFAAQQAGVETEKFNKALKFFTKGIGEATQGKGLAKEAFDDLGISVFNTNGKVKSAEKLFLEFFKALEKVENSNRRNAFLTATFGGKMADLANLIKDGSVAMEALAASATGIFSNETIANAERFNDSMNKLTRLLTVPLQSAFVKAADDFLMLLEKLGVEGIVEKTVINRLNEDLQKFEKQLQTAKEKADGFQGTFGELIKFGTNGKNIYEENVKQIQKQIAETENLIALEQAKIDLLNEESDIIEFNETQLKAMSNVSKELNRGFEEFFDFSKKGFLDFENLTKRILNTVLNEMIKVFLIKRLFEVGAKAAGGTGTVLGKILQGAADSYEGGGFTGTGSRTGGVDGRGGFPAILHPNETVIDHTKGQGMGATVNFNITTVDAASFDNLLASRKGLITQIINNAMNTKGKMGVV